MANSIDNTMDIIDSRDVIARIEELEDERGELETALQEASAAVEEERAANDGAVSLTTARAEIHAEDALSEWDESEEGRELDALRKLADEAEDYAPDWHHGEALIRDSYFKEYAQELADDIGAVDSSAGWPNSCIDWDQAARELQMDYTAVDFDGVTYWVRS